MSTDKIYIVRKKREQREQRKKLNKYGFSALFALFADKKQQMYYPCSSVDVVFNN